VTALTRQTVTELISTDRTQP